MVNSVTNDSSARTGSELAIWQHVTIAAMWFEGIKAANATLALPPNVLRKTMAGTSRAITLRPSLKDVTANHALAAKLLSAAADAYLRGDMDLARQKLLAADIPALFRFGRLLMDRSDPEIVWPPRKRGTGSDIVRTKERMPPQSEMLSLCVRDGWHCRYCGCLVIYGRAREVLRKAFPTEVPWPASGPMHGGFFALTATADHIVPHSRGGDNTQDNLVTSCWPCNFGMENDSLDELGLSDPRLRPPVLDSWDGLTRLLAHPVQPVKPIKPQAERETPALVLRQSAKLRGLGGSLVTQSAWYTGLDVVQRRLADSFLTFLPTLSGLGVSWSANEVLIVRMVVGGFTVQFFGVQPDLAVQVPWATNAPKQNLREFAEFLAAGIPEAVVRETPKLWNVGFPPEKTVRFESLLNRPDEVRQAIEVLHARLSRPALAS